jgi:hypothetical protein
MTDDTTTKVATFCPLCVSRCGATATIAEDEFGYTPAPHVRSSSTT